MELCLRPGGWLSALARLFAAEDPAPQSRAQARPEVNARAEKLLDAYGDLMLRYAYSYLHNMADAEEVLQDTLVQFLKTAPVFLNKAHEKAWLLRVAANLSKNRLSYNKLRQTDELNEELTAEGREDLSFVWDAAAAGAVPRGGAPVLLRGSEHPADRLCAGPERSDDPLRPAPGTGAAEADPEGGVRL